MRTMLERVSNAVAQGTRSPATPNAHRGKDQTFKISQQREERTSPGWLTFTAVNWISFSALQTPGDDAKVNRGKRLTPWMELFFSFSRHD